MDKTTFEQLYRDMLPSLYRLAQSILHQSADAQDAVQQAAVKAWMARERIRPGNERAYFARTAINECRNIQRQRMRMFPVADFPDQGYMPPDTDLANAITNLPEQLRLPILLKYMEGYSEKETAAALEITVPTLKARLFKARRQLERELKEEVELG